MALDVPVNEAPCCMLLSLFTIVYTNVIVSGVPYNISTLFKYPMCFYISHYELIEYNAHKVDRELYHVFNWTVSSSPAASQ